MNIMQDVSCCCSTPAYANHVNENAHNIRYLTENSWAGGYRVLPGEYLEPAKQGIRRKELICSCSSANMKPIV